MEKIINIDFHAHILPGADHGCDNENMCLKQLELAKKYKIDMIVATPHFYPNTDTVKSFLNRRSIAYEKLKKVYTPALPQVLLGAEVLVCNNMDKMDDLDKLCIEGTDTILVEMPFEKHWDKRLIETVINIKQVRGLNVVLAHIDRYNPIEVKKLTDMDIAVQINAIALFKLKTKAKCKYYFENCKVVALGSDIHKLSDSYKYLYKAIKKQEKNESFIMKRTNAIIAKKA